mgnify:FL=1
MPVRLEHANMSVHDIDRIIRFLQTAFPEFGIRRDAVDPDGSRWVHVGTDDSYIALTQAAPDSPKRLPPYEGKAGLNHLAYEVSDADALRARMLEAGYTESTVPNAHPYRKRVYFYDPEGNDWEFIQYLSDDPAKRHDYETPDR